MIITAHSSKVSASVQMMSKTKNNLEMRLESRIQTKIGNWRKLWLKIYATNMMVSNLIKLKVHCLRNYSKKFKKLTNSARNKRTFSKWLFWLSFDSNKSKFEGEKYGAIITWFLRMVDNSIINHILKFKILIKFDY